MSEQTSPSPSDSVRDGMQGAIYPSVRFALLHREDPMERIRMVRAGLPAQALDGMATRFGISKESLYTLLGITRATAARQVRAEKPLNEAATERAVFLAGLVIMVANMLPEVPSRPAEFDAARWVAQWLATPQPALAGECPQAYLDTADGRTIVRRLLSQLESGAYG